MTIPTFVTDWLKANGFELYVQVYDKNPVFRTATLQIDFSNYMVQQLRCMNMKPQWVMFTIPIPSNEQDFLTLMNILLK